MSVEEARSQYADWVEVFFSGNCPDRPTCSVCDWGEREMDAASIALDLAVAQASLERTRASVAW